MSCDALNYRYRLICPLSLPTIAPIDRFCSLSLSLSNCSLNRCVWLLSLPPAPHSLTLPLHESCCCRCCPLAVCRENGQGEEIDTNFAGKSRSNRHLHSVVLNMLPKWHSLMMLMMLLLLLNDTVPLFTLHRKLFRELVSRS